MMKESVQKFLDDVFASNELNRLPDEYGGGFIFDPPLIGVSGGDDPIFERFKEVVAPEHLTPVEMWIQSGTGSDKDTAATLRNLSIIFPYVKKIRDESASAEKMPADIYSIGRNWANPFMNDVMQKTVQYFQTVGYRAVAGARSKAFRVIIKTDPARRYSVWSERHMAFAAGLGTFSLHEGLITDAGCNHRVASVLTDAPLEVTPRANDDPYGNCLFYSQGTCKECVDRCPAGALSEQGHDKEKCRSYLGTVQKVMGKRLGSALKPSRRRFEDGEKVVYPVGCGFCQFGVPCMDKNPVATSTDV